MFIIILQVQYPRPNIHSRTLKYYFEILSLVAVTTKRGTFHFLEWCLTEVDKFTVHYFDSLFLYWTKRGNMILALRCDLNNTYSRLEFVLFLFHTFVFTILPSRVFFKDIHYSYVIWLTVLFLLHVLEYDMTWHHL